MSKKHWVFICIAAVCVLLVLTPIVFNFKPNNLMIEKCKEFHADYTAAPAVYYTAEECYESITPVTFTSQINYEYWIRGDDFLEIFNSETKQKWYVRKDGTAYSKEICDDAEAQNWKQEKSTYARTVPLSDWSDLEGANPSVKRGFLYTDVSYVIDLGSDNCTFSRTIATYTFRFDQTEQLQKLIYTVTSYDGQRIDPSKIGSTLTKTYQIHIVDESEAIEKINEQYAAAVNG